MGSRLTPCLLRDALVLVQRRCAREYRKEISRELAHKCQELEVILCQKNMEELKVVLWQR